MESPHIPSFLYRFLVGGPSFDTLVLHACNGRELRSSNCTVPINRYSIQNCNVSARELETLQEFFCLMQGRKRFFLVRDPVDNKVSKGLLLSLDKNVPTFQLAKFYGESELKTHRLVSQFVDLKVYYDEALIEDYKVDGGILDFSESKFKEEIITNSQKLCASFNFFIPVRFDIDRLRYNCSLAGGANVEEFELLEVLV